MKKAILLIFAIGLFTSCGVTTKLPEPYGYSSFLDYSPLTKRGIYVTESNSVSFDYQTIGSVAATEVGGWVKKKEVKEVKKTTKDREDDMYAGVDRNQNAGKKVHVSPSLNAAMERMANTLKDVGANGIINLKVQMDHHRIVISGMAIRK